MTETRAPGLLTAIYRLALGLVFASLFAVGSTACTNEACLVTGENCSASYKEAEYDTTDIWCCEGSCVDSSIAPGARVCR